MSGYPVEMLDEYIRLQEATNDHQIRAVIRFGGRLDLGRFEMAVRESLGYAPILACKYVTTEGEARWESASFPWERLFRVVPAKGDADGPADAIEAELIDYLKVTADVAGPQIVVQVLQGERDTVVITVNHMAFDGAGFKTYLYLLSRLYSGETVELELVGANASGSSVDGANTGDVNAARGMDTLLRNIPVRKRLFSLFRKTFSGAGAAILDEGEESSARLALLRIEGEKLAKVRAFCAERGVTVNDFVLALFCASIMGLKGGPRVDELTLQVMIDLRRYVSSYPVSPFGNFSSMESLRVKNSGASFADLAVAVSRAMGLIKTRLPGVKNVLLMNEVWKRFPRVKFDELLSAKIRAIGLSTSNLGILQNEALRFAGLKVVDAFVLASIKRQPALQLSFSTFQDRVTLGILGNYSERNWETITRIVEGMEKELATAS